jgi:Bacterial PH domain
MTEQQVVFDQQKQLDLVREGLQPDEQVIAVYDAIGTGTGFIGLTDRRAIVQDNSFVGKRVALTSIPFSQITSVSFVTNKSMFGRLASNSAIAIHTASKTYEVEFRGENKGKHVHDIVLWKILQ